MSAQDKELFSAFAEVAEPVLASFEDDEALETLTYIAFLLEGIKSALESTAAITPAAVPKSVSSSPSPTSNARSAPPQSKAPSFPKEASGLPSGTTGPNTRAPSAQKPSPIVDTKGTPDDATERGSGAAVRAKQRAQHSSTTAVSSPQASLLAFPATAAVEPRSSASTHTDQAGNAGKSKSQEQLEKEQQASSDQKQGGLLEDLKRNLSDWDGTAIGGRGEDNLQDAAGMAVDGPLFAAVKDIARLVETDENDKSLLGVLKKTVADKTGITAAKDWAAQKKEKLIGTIQGWAGGKTEPSQSQASGGQRDAQGSFLPKKTGKPKPLPPLPTDEEKQQLEFTEALVTGQTKEAKLSEQRHEDIMQALRQGSGGGLFDKAKGAVDWLREKRRGNTGNTSKGQLDGRQGRRQDKRRARKGDRLGHRNGSLLQTRGDRRFCLPEEASPVSTRGRAGKKGLATPKSGRMGSGLLGKGMAAGTKGLLGAAKMLPMVGQVLAGGMALMNGFQGWNNAEGQQAAFDLKPGEEATTGQKASYAAASALDMGGLFTGIAQGLGFDLNTEDIAKGLYSAAEFAGSVAETISSSASGIAASLTDGFLNLTSSIGAKAGELWTSASSSVGSAMSAVAGAAQGLLDSATATVSETVSAISTKGTELWNSATSAWNSTTEAVSNVADATRQKAASLLDSSLAWFGFGDGNTGSTKDKSPATKQPDTTPPQSPVAQSTTAQVSAPVAATETPATPPTVEQSPPKSEPVAAAANVASEQTTSTALSTSKEEKKQPHGTTARIGTSNAGEVVLSEPGEAMTSLFTGLTQSLDALKQSVDSAMTGEDTGSIFSSVQGMASGMGSWFNRMTSRFGVSGSASSGGRTGGDGSGGTRSAGPTGASRYVPDPNAKIGEAIAKYESGAQGSSAIGYDGTGGTSYGKYQLASKAGSMEGFLKMMEGKGGEHAAIAARLRASGPMNTGSKQGAMPEQWKKEAAANGDLLKSAELEYMVKENYAPAMQRLGDGLRGKVEGSKALQEAMFSTSVQHGAYGKAGAAGIWNKAYKDGMSDEDLIRAVYSERATRFGSSTPQVQESARRRMASEQELVLSMKRGEGATQPAMAAVQNSPQDQAVQSAASASIQGSTQAAIDRGVRYSFGSKRSKSGGIDCSGWVTEINRNLMTSVNAAMGQDVYSAEARQVLTKGANGGAAGIIQAVSGATGELLHNADLSPDKIREGMMIGMDTGNKGWDAGRYNGIDHIVQTYKDELTGKMMVSESRGGKGVMNTDYEEWYKKNSRHSLYGADVTKLADASKLPQQANTALATATTPEAATSAPATEATVATLSPATTVAQPPIQAQALVASGQEPPLVSAPAYVQGRVADSRRVQEPEILREPASPQPNLNFGSLETLLAQLIEVVREQKSPADSQERKERFPDIRVEYDDPYLVQMAHDRA